MAGIDRIEIITLADERYALPLAAMVRSVLDQLEPARRVRITVIDGGISESIKRELERSWSSSAAWPRCRVEWKTPDYGDEAEIPVWGRVPKITYARIHLSAYLPDATRVILLDSDVLALTCVGRLWDTPLEGAVAGATVDPFVPFVSSRDGLARYAELGMPADAPYLNAGVMLVDLDRWRREEIARKAFAYIQKNWQVTRWYDQDALNAVLAGRWRELDGRWQAQPRAADLSMAGGAAGAQPWIVHFSGRLKPWVYEVGSSADREFFAVLDRTAWSGWRPSRSARTRLTALYARRLRPLLYPLEVRALGYLDRYHRWRLTPKAG